MCISQFRENIQSLLKHIAKASQKLWLSFSLSTFRGVLKALVDPISNDLALSCEWKIEDSWTWSGKSHIKLLETASALKLMRKVAREGWDCRLVYLGDSHVSRLSLARGRISSNALRPMLRQSAALSVRFGITLLGDFHLRGLCQLMPQPGSPGQFASYSVLDLVFKSSGLPGVQSLSTLPKTRRWISNWIRLTLILLAAISNFHVGSESVRVHPVSYTPEPHIFSQFDSTLGFPVDLDLWPLSFCWAVPGTIPHASFCLGLSWGVLLRVLVG